MLRGLLTRHQFELSASALEISPLSATGTSSASV